MNKRKLHQLTGTIKHAYLGTSKSKSWKNHPFYLLVIQQESLFTGPVETNLYVFPSQVPLAVWTILEQRTFETKKYQFFCEKRVRGWRLKGMEELSD